MRRPRYRLLPATAVLALVGAISQTAPVQGQEVGAAPSGEAVIEQGRQIAYDRKKGNCLACHVIEGGKLPGNIGPPLMAMKARFPDKAKLRSQIADATKNNPNTIMPPFETYGVLSKDEVDKVTEFIYSL